VVGGNEVCPGANGGTDDMEGVMDVDTEGSFTQVVAAEEGVAEGVEGGVGTGTVHAKKK
jgi:hypothetical protein